MSAAHGGSFASQVWQWWGEEEYRCILAVCEVFPALEYLAQDADSQASTTPMCPACVAWYDHMVTLPEMLNAWGARMPAEVRSCLERVRGLCEGLGERSMVCGCSQIFHEDDWVPLRAAAAQALLAMDAEALSPYLESLQQDCRAADERRRRSGLYIG